MYKRISITLLILSTFISISIFSSIANAGWVYLPSSLQADVPAGGSIIIRTYTQDNLGNFTNVWTQPFIIDQDGSGTQINPDGTKVQLSSVSPYPLLTPQMTSFSSTPADQWFTQFDTVIAAGMFSSAFLLIAMSGAIAQSVGILISMFGRR